jgi:hypothetical protein
MILKRKMKMNYLKYLFEKKNPDYSWFRVLKCRIQGHKKGVIWYNVSGIEPDMTCRGCGDNLS